MSGVPVWFGVLGSLRVVADGAQEPLLVSAGRLRAVLAVLLWRANQPVSVDELSELVWDAAPPSGAPAALRALIVRLRRALGPQAGARIVTRSPGYMIELFADELDATRFDALYRDAETAVRANSWSDLSTAAARALELWRGAPLADVPCQALQDAWTPGLEQRRLQTLEWRIEADLHLGRQDRAVRELRELTTRHPLRERFHVQLMLALASTGRQAEALEAYRDARGVLTEELGIEPGPELRDVHERILASKDVRLAAQMSASAPPAPPPAPVVPRQLPAAPGHFTGRRDELEALTELVERSHPAAAAGGTVVISAIDGMAGIGKTALAVHAAHRLAKRFPDGQLFIDLHGYSEAYPPRTAIQALEALLPALGVAPQQIPPGVEERAALYRQRLAGSRTLIVLDNATDEAQVRPLIPGDPGCLVLVTSRRKLQALDDAYTVTLDVLAQSAAIKLFCAIAGPGRVAANDPVIAEIVGLCGHLPLAVRIAAALLRNRPAWSAQHVATRLRDAHTRLDALAGGDRNLAALFDLSAQALDDDPRRLYRRLSLIPGPEIDGYAAAALLDADLHVADRLLQQLADHSLLLEPAAGRYQMHDLIRAHTHATSAADPAPEREAARGRLLDYYQHTAGRADARIARHPEPTPGCAGPACAPALPDTDTARAWLRAERTNITACLQYAIQSGQDERCVAFAAGLASLLRIDGPWPAATATHAAAAAAAARLGDRPAQTRALTELGILHRLAADYQAARRCLDAALELCREAGGEPDQARILMELGFVLRVTGDHTGAARNAHAALNLYEAAGDKPGQALALRELAQVQYATADYPGMTVSLRAALVLSLESDDRSAQAAALADLAKVQNRTGDYEEALRNSEAALVMARQLGDAGRQAVTLMTLARAQRMTGDYENATRNPQIAFELLRQLGNRPLQADALLHVAEAQRMTGDYSGAVGKLEEALDIYREYGCRASQATAMRYYAAAVSATGDSNRAAALYDEALHQARELNQPDDEAAALEGLGEIHLRQGNLQQGASNLRQALEIYQRLGMPEAKQITTRLTEISSHKQLQRRRDTAPSEQATMTTDVIA